MADNEQGDEAPEVVAPKSFVKDTLQHARDDSEGGQKKSFTVNRVQEDYRESED